VCSSCTILPVKVMNADGQGDLAVVAQGIVRAADMHARVIDLSLGGPAPLDALKHAVDYALSKGAIVVAAAGNSGRGTPFYPANYPNVLGVAGTTSHDHLYGWSERGSWVQVAAPGCNVAPLTHGYGMFCGTSSATPLVAGLAGLAVSLKPHATNLQVIKAIEATAHRIGANAGHGRIDAGRALGALG
jgi:subtilisin family serine protease